MPANYSLSTNAILSLDYNMTWYIISIKKKKTAKWLGVEKKINVSVFSSLSLSYKHEFLDLSIDWRE